MSRIVIKLKPNSKQEKTLQSGKNNYEAWVKEPAVESKANNALIKLLMKEFKIPKSDIHIVKGSKSRYKTIEIKDK